MNTKEKVYNCRKRRMALCWRLSSLFAFCRVLGGVAILNESDTKAAETATENQLETTCRQQLSEVPFEVKTLDGSIYKVVCDEEGSCTKINEGRK